MSSTSALLASIVVLASVPATSTVAQHGRRVGARAITSLEPMAHEQHGCGRRRRIDGATPSSRARIAFGGGRRSARRARARGARRRRRLAARARSPAMARSAVSSARTSVSGPASISKRSRSVAVRAECSASRSSPDTAWSRSRAPMARFSATRQVGKTREVLVHEAQTRVAAPTAGVVRSGVDLVAAGTVSPPAIAAVHAGEDLDQRRLPRPVAAHRARGSHRGARSNDTSSQRPRAGERLREPEIDAQRVPRRPSSGVSCAHAFRYCAW